MTRPASRSGGDSPPPRKRTRPDRAAGAPAAAGQDRDGAAPAGPLGRALAAMAAAGGGIGTVLLLGGGRCADPLACLGAGARHVVVLEPDPDRLRALRRRAGRSRRLRLTPGTVAASDGVARLHVHNHAPLSALRPPAQGLRALFPGLRLLREVTVETVSPATLAGSLPAPGPAPDLLLIDTPGEEATVLDGLEAAGALLRFGHVVLRCGTAEHYEGSAPLEVLAARLTALGYRMETPLEDPDEGDPDRPWRRFRLEPLVLEVAALRAELRQHKDEIARLRRETIAARERADAAVHAGMAAEAEATRRQADRMEALREDLAMAVRLQALRDADLRDLQERHARLMHEKERQDALLEQLTERLGAAAQYLRQLDGPYGDDPAAMTDRTPQEPDR